MRRQLGNRRVQPYAKLLFAVLVSKALRCDIFDQLVPGQAILANLRIQAFTCR